ncbi:MAG: hypothetical protein NVS4B3_12540 [Gemmatimonadaceae bacterium]
MSDGGRPAAFLDRDGTIIVDRHYVARAEDVVLLPGAAQAITRLNAAGIVVVVVTNQSGIARGYLTEAEYLLVAARLNDVLAEHGAEIVASYHCPHHPDRPEGCRCRKPGRLLYDRAITDLGLDASKSLFAGDRLRDIQAAATFGGVGILVPMAETSAADRIVAERDFAVAPNLGAAVERFLAGALAVGSRFTAPKSGEA